MYISPYLYLSLSIYIVYIFDWFLFGEGEPPNLAKANKPEKYREETHGRSDIEALGRQCETGGLLFDSAWQCRGSVRVIQTKAGARAMQSRDSHTTTKE